MGHRLDLAPAGLVGQRARDVEVEDLGRAGGRLSRLGAAMIGVRLVLPADGEGRSNLAIAQHTGSQISTVEKHLSTINAKLGLNQATAADRKSVNVRVLATLEFLRSSSG
jgi:hypothetical protein